jgi:hypothetical protein
LAWRSIDQPIQPSLFPRWWGGRHRLAIGRTFRGDCGLDGNPVFIHRSGHGRGIEPAFASAAGKSQGGDNGGDKRENGADNGAAGGPNVARGNQFDTPESILP